MSESIYKFTSRMLRRFKHTLDLKLKSAHWRNHISMLLKNLDRRRISEIYSDTAYINECKRYLRSFFPGYTNVSWHVFMVYFNNQKRVEYIPADLFYSIIIDQLNTRHFQSAYDDKNAYDLVLKAARLPKTIARVVNGFIYDSTYNLLSANDLKRLLLRYDKPIIIKNTAGTLGVKEVKKIMPGTINDHVIETMREKNWLIQECIEQHPLLSRLNPSSVNTIRVITVRVEGEIIKLNAILRMGVGEVSVDNVHRGGIGCGIHDDANLYERGYDSGYNELTYHPISKINFADVHVPGYHSAVKMCLACHAALLHLDYIAWDVAIDKEGNPVVIEMNLKRPDILGMQVIHGPLFGEYTSAILGKIKVPRPLRFV